MNFKALLREFYLLVSCMTIKKTATLITAYACYLASRILSRPVVSSQPCSISIEPTSRCNLRCPECPTGTGVLTRPKGDLQQPDFEKIIQQVTKHVYHISLYFQGEPFLNANLTSMIAVASKNGLFTSVSTNGHFIDSTSAREMIKAGLKKIIFSVDGATQHSYSEYRKNGNLKAVLDAVALVKKLRKEAKTLYPLIEIQCIVLRSNEHELPAVKMLAREAGADRVSFKTAQHYDLSASNPLITRLEKYCRYRHCEGNHWTLKRNFKKACSRIWTVAVITWDLRLVSCCYDKNADFEMGNLKKQSLSEIWKGSTFNRFRQKVLKTRESIPICNNCNEGL